MARKRSTAGKRSPELPKRRVPLVRRAANAMRRDLNKVTRLVGIRL